MEQAERATDWRREQVGDRAEGSSATGDGGQAALTLTPDVDGTGSGSLLVRIFKSSQLKGLYVGDFPP